MAPDVDSGGHEKTDSLHIEWTLDHTKSLYALLQSGLVKIGQEYFRSFWRRVVVIDVVACSLLNARQNFGREPIARLFGSGAGVTGMGDALLEDSDPSAYSYALSLF